MPFLQGSEQHSHREDLTTSEHLKTRTHKKLTQTGLDGTVGLAMAARCSSGIQHSTLPLPTVKQTSGGMRRTAKFPAKCKRHWWSV